MGGKYSLLSLKINFWLLGDVFLGVPPVNVDLFLAVRVLAETKNRSQAPYIPFGRYVP